MLKYAGQKRILVATDCIIFGFDGWNLKLLLVHRNIEPEKNKWSLMGGFMQPSETPGDAANRVLELRTGLKNVYMEQFQVFGKPGRDPVERTLSIAYFALIDIHQYEKQLNDEYHAEWFLLSEMPELIFDHNEMVKLAQRQLRYKAALHPIIIYSYCPKNLLFRSCSPFMKAFIILLSTTAISAVSYFRTGLLVKLHEKDKFSSKKGAFYYKLDQSENYAENFTRFLNLVPNPDKFF